MSQTSARIINMAAVTGICIVLLAAYGVQFIFHELPCPLCLLQRIGMLGVAFGAMLNLKFGSRPGHYGVSLISALFGASVSVRQILLHIVPGTGSYGSPILQLHLYTWAFLIFSTAAVVISILLMFDRQFQNANFQAGGLRGYAKVIFVLVIIIAVANVVSAFLECGLEPCPDNPDKYIMLSLL